MKGETAELNGDKIRLDLEEASLARRRSIAKRVWPLVQAGLKAIPQLLRVARNAWRRAVSDMEGRVISAEDEPIYKPAYRRKEVAARWALVASIIFDLVIGIVISISVFQMPLRWAVLAGLVLTLTVAFLAKGLAALAVHYEHLGRWTRQLLSAAGFAFVLIMLALVVVYLTRSGLLPMGVVGFIVPALVVACAVQAGAFSALADIFAHPNELAKEVRQLEVRHAELQALQEELSEAIEGPHRGNGAEHLDTAPRRASGRFVPGAARGLGMLILLSAFSFGAARADNEVPGRVTILADVSDTGDMSPEAARINCLLANHLGAFVDGLGDVGGVTVVRWSDAASVWQSGQSFEFPRLPARHALGEEQLAFFAQARQAEEERRREQELKVRSTALRQVGDTLLAPLQTRPSSSCIHDALNRAAELPASDYVLVTSDLASFRCPTKPRPNAAGPVIGIIQIPRREGQVRERMLERRRAIERAYPGVLVLESYRLTDVGSLCVFGRMLRETASRRRGR